MKGSKCKIVNGQIFEKAANLWAYFSLSRDGIAVPTFSYPNGPTYRKEVSNKTQMASTRKSALTPDPYEAQFLEVEIVARLFPDLVTNLAIL